MTPQELDELTRLAFIYAEADRASLADSYHDKGEEGIRARKLAEQFRAYRLARWGKTKLDIVMEGCVQADPRTLFGGS